MDSLLDLGINLILIAIIPAVGEELLFEDIFKSLLVNGFKMLI